MLIREPVTEPAPQGNAGPPQVSLPPAGGGLGAARPWGCSQHGHAHGWHAALELGYERRGARTVLAHRRHSGPMCVQKALYPEGTEVCHGLLLHPPGGICGGDRLAISVNAAGGAHALLTTPGATKWYRSAGAAARQSVSLTLDDAATLEWLPQDNIVFDGARARIDNTWRLAADAKLIAWDVLCLGRSAAGERFAHGRLKLVTRIERAGRLLWLERGDIAGGSALLDAPAGLAGQPVCGTLVACAPQIPEGLVAALRAHAPSAGRGGITALPQLIVARYLGASAEAARAWFVALWRVLRPALAGRDAVAPRIWAT